MKDDYDVVPAEIGAWLHCCVTGSRLFAAKLLLIVMLPLRAQTCLRQGLLKMLISPINANEIVQSRY